MAGTKGDIEVGYERVTSPVLRGALSGNSIAQIGRQTKGGVKNKRTDQCGRDIYQ